MKKIFTVILILMLMCITHVSAEEIPTSGTCGENAVWSYSNGVLTISGSGAMDHPTQESWDRYALKYEHQWNAYINDIVEVKINEGITSLGGKAFTAHPVLKKVTLPSTLTVISYDVFSNCPMLCDIELPDSLTTIDSEAFYQCTSLENILLPESLKEIGRSAFLGCSSLKAIEFPENIEIIGDYAFSGCEGLKEIKIPTRLKELGYSAFRFTGIDEVYYPAQENPDAEIGDAIFGQCANLKKVVFDEKITEFGRCMFWYCPSLEEVILPPGITYIPTQAFQNCTSLTTVTIPSGVTQISGSAFKNCYALSDIVLPDALTAIASDAFSGCTSLTKIRIPEGVTRIDTGLFNGCSSLKSVQLPDGITTIGGYAFNNCTSLESINVPKALQAIYERAFSGCTSLKELVLPDGITTVMNYAFENCGTITVYFPPSVEKLGYSLFINTQATIYARPETEIYGTGVKTGCTVYDYYLPNVGDVVDQIVDSDIYVTLNGELIPSYCIDGKTLILVRDLERYGFEVSFDSENKIAYATFNPNKAPYEGIATRLPNRDVLYTDIRAVVNGVEIEVRNSNGFVAVEAERLGNYVPEISCVWQSKERRLQMQAFEGMASFEDLVNSISERKGITYTEGCTNFADTTNGRFDVFAERKYFSVADYNGYIYPERGLRVADFIWVAGNAYELKADTAKGASIHSYYPSYLRNGIIALCQLEVITPDENNCIYLDGILTRAQMEYYLDILDSKADM